MFNTAIFFRIAEDFVLPPLEALEEIFQSHRFVPCGATEPESSGWVPPRGNKSTVLLELRGPLGDRAVVHRAPARALLRRQGRGGRTH
jgi:recombination associated protein RdgC